jgi:hypothetical protein
VGSISPVPKQSTLLVWAFPSLTVLGVHLPVLLWADDQLASVAHIPFLTAVPNFVDHATFCKLLSNVLVSDMVSPCYSTCWPQESPLWRVKKSLLSFTQSPAFGNEETEPSLIKYVYWMKWNIKKTFWNTNKEEHNV